MTPAQVFSYELCDIFNNTIFTEHFLFHCFSKISHHVLDLQLKIDSRVFRTRFLKIKNQGKMMCISEFGIVNWNSRLTCFDIFLNHLDCQTLFSNFRLQEHCHNRKCIIRTMLHHTWYEKQCWVSVKKRRKTINYCQI